MAVKIALDSFLAVTKRSNLVARDQLKSLLDAYLSAGGERDNARQFADYLVRRQALTAWQADKLLQGKHKGFFLGKYKLLSLLGKGGMSSVYLAEHVLMRRHCAIKVLPTRRVRDASYLARFHREAQAVAALDHPNIVRAYDVDHEVDGEMDIHYLVMEFVDGKSLLQLVQEHPHGRLPVAVAADYIRQAALGLAHAHAAGLVHRDIKPGNLLVDGQGTVRLLDLGLARFFDGSEELSLTVQHDERVLGTADYLAPEQAIDSHHVDARADLYSLGCTTYFCLTGHPPFTHGTLAQRLLAHQTKEPPPIESLQPDVPDSLGDIVRRMMAKDPAARFQSADEVADALGRWLTEYGGLQHVPPVRPTRPPLRRAPRHHDETPLPQGDTMHRGAAVEPLVRKRPRQPPPQPAPPRGTAPHKSPSVSESDAAPSTPRQPAQQEHPGKAVERGAVCESAMEGVSVEAVAAETPVLTPLYVDDQPSDRPEPDPLAIRNDSERATSWVFDVPLEDSSIKVRAARGRGTGGSSLIRGKGTRRHPSQQVWVSVVLAALVLVAFLIWALSQPANREGSSRQKGTVAEHSDSPAADKSVVPRPDLGPELHVKPGGDFETIAAALQYIRDHHHRFTGQPSWTVKLLAGGVYEEPLLIENGGLGGFPPGVQIVCDGEAPAILRPQSSSGPIVRLDGVERLLLRGLVLEGGGREVVVELSGFLVGTQLERVEIRDIGGAGIEWADASGVPSAPLQFVRVKFSGRSPAAVAVRMGDVRQARFEDCRFVGPMRSGLEFTSSSWNADVSIRHCVFFDVQTGIRFSGSAQDVQRIQLINNTFHRVQRGLAFDSMPQRGSAGLVVHHNLFSQVSGAESYVGGGIEAETAQTLLPPGSARNNWSDRSTDGGDAEVRELILFEEGRQGVESLSFASTDPTHPAFLKPNSGGAQNAVKSPAPGADPFVGAIAP